ncbi:MAG: type II toxin-antitoxin system MqsA family antitoxin [Candidatus Hydrogenedentes bacterium]|nr:type II toxin-antitoxin system MqsA family antitoxin [Candidatus Hydrogenedentota bacterium]
MNTWNTAMTDIPELTEADFAAAIPASVRNRLTEGKVASGSDIVALRHFVRMTEVEFAEAMGVSVNTLRNWEQGHWRPEGPALALLRIAARHPRIIRESLNSVATA